MPIHGTGLWMPDIGGLLLIGASGSGKSTLALQWIQQAKAVLVSDDQVRLVPSADGWRMQAPETIRGLLLIDGVLHRLPYRDDVALTAILRLDDSPAPVEGVPDYSLVEFDSVEAESRLRLQ